jgi:hypothetical protein
VPERFDSSSYVSPPPTNRQSTYRDGQNPFVNAPRQLSRQDQRSATPTLLTFDRQIEEQEVLVTSEFKNLASKVHDATPEDRTHHRGK